MPAGNVLETGFGGIVGGDTGGADEPGTATLAHQAQEGFGEHGVEVHIPHPGERETPAGAHELAGRLGGLPGLLKLLVQPTLGQTLALGGIFRRFVERLNQAVASCRIGCGGDIGGPAGEELLFLQLDALPRRIPQHTVEPEGWRMASSAWRFVSPRPIRRLPLTIRPLKHLRKLDVPMKEPMAPRQFPGLLRHLLAHCPALAPGDQVPAGGHRVDRLRPLGGEEGGHEQIGGFALVAAAVALARRLPDPALFFHLFRGVLRHMIESNGAETRLGHALAEVHGHDPALAGGLVGLLQLGGGLLVVAGERLVGVVGNAFGENRRVQHAHQGVAAADVGSQKAQRLARLHRLQPEGGLAQLHRQGVDIHAIDAVGHHLAQGVAIISFRGLVSAGAQARHLGSQAPGGSEQEMAGTRCRVHDLETQQGLDRLLAVLLQGALDHRLQGRVDQLLHQAVGGVVAAGGLAGTAALFFLRRLAARLRVAQKDETPGTVLHLNHRHQLQQALIDAAQLLGAHVTVVDAHQAVVGLEPAQMEQGLVEETVAQTGGVQMRALVGSGS